MAKSVVITKRQQKLLKKRFSLYGSVAECQRKTGVPRDTILRVVAIGRGYEETINKLSKFIGEPIEIEQA
jgi:hypothetical protein